MIENNIASMASNLKSGIAEMDTAYRLYVEFAETRERLSRTPEPMTETQKQAFLTEIESIENSYFTTTDNIKLVRSATDRVNTSGALIDSDGQLINSSGDRIDKTGNLI